MKYNSALLPVFFFLIFLYSCNQTTKNEFVENTPTSGKLNVYFDEGLSRHVKNQAITFASQYERAELFLHETSESQAVEALYNDSCETIVIARNLTENEKNAFASKKYGSHFTIVAQTGVAVIANANSPLKYLSVDQIVGLLRDGKQPLDSTGLPFPVTILFDKNNSGVLHYVLDSVVGTKQLSTQCSILNGTTESINYVASHPGAIAFIDFSWLSDVDDSIYKANQNKIKFIALSKKGSKIYEYPNQSSFKLGTYPFVRNIYVIRKTGDFTLAKGFESFVAGPKGQLTFLKQGLLPARQAERRIEVNMAPVGTATTQ